MAADFKELIHCFTVVYIQANPKASLDDFLWDISGIRSAKKIPMTDGAPIMPGTRLTADMVKRINKHKDIQLTDDMFFVRDDHDPFSKFVGPNGALGTEVDVSSLLSHLPVFRVYQNKIVFDKLKEYGNRITRMTVSFLSMKNFLSYTQLSNKKYLALNQYDPFVRLVKNEALSKIKKAFNFQGKIDLLSPVDFYIVDPVAKRSIEQDIRKHILDASDLTILDNFRTNKNNYRTILNKYFGSRQLFGVSSKIGTKNFPAKAKIVGTTHFGAKSLVGSSIEKHVDPYTRMIRYLYENPTKIDYIIDSVINIRYDELDVRPDGAVWSINVDFNYDSLEEGFGAPVTFFFEALPDAGYNGKYFKNFSTKAKTPWTGGVQDENIVAKIIFDMYKTSFTENDFLKKRATGAPPQLKEFLSEKKYISQKSLLDKCKSLNIPKETIDEYLVESVMAMLGTYAHSEQDHKSSSFDKKLKAYRKAQHFYFLTEPKIRMQAKKAIFLTFYGIVTKKGYFNFDGSSIKAMISVAYDNSVNDIRKSVAPQLLVAEFKAAPHIVMGTTS